MDDLSTLIEKLSAQVSETREIEQVSENNLSNYEILDQPPILYLCLAMVIFFSISGYLTLRKALKG